MKKGFYAIIAAQFVSSLADNALLIAAIALLGEMRAAQWVTPLIQFCFSISYVVLAPFVGAFADAMPKGRVMLLSNALKAFGCLAMLFGLHPMLAYAVVGIGAAAYSPAKYGILTELLPADKLVAANGWIEAATVGSTIAGTVLGGALISRHAAPVVAALHLPALGTVARAALLVVMLIYIIASLINLRIPDTGARYDQQLRHPGALVTQFGHACSVLWHDRPAQIVLAVTTLLWGAAVTLQLLILKWAGSALGMTLSGGAVLQGVIGIGLAFGAAYAARHLSLRRAMSALPVGIVTGVAIVATAFYNRSLFGDAALDIAGQHLSVGVILAYPLIALIGALSGYFVVPMNAVLQHRGHVLLSAGASIAVQNFNQNIAVLIMLGLYALMLAHGWTSAAVIGVLGSVICVAMAGMIAWHRRNERRFGVVPLGDDAS
ncbi:lysophospholipid transporter LplT [Chitinasiproducens palmae]|uniref:Major Facilitator Superfamily protein n=1 Tax=Chitinasiproducens palmae TaxID=1770053 RepID=A0A1H2PRV4_9BURK|nr:lysophospholipid transporter LplT [Chitinasiproducens palmae]SDV49656.1 Major Facilitator Superfamily protein [Chitinasiproducens palmae]